MSWRMKVVVAYLGGPFHGWQRQARDRTVQGELEKAYRRMTHQDAPTFVGAGRTDAGVHARGQTAHLDLEHSIPADSLMRGLNGTLPQEIRIRSVQTTTPSFHAQRDAKGKLYTYRARFHSAPLPWVGLRSAQMPALKSLEDFERAVAMLPGRRDMASFTVRDPEQEDTVKTLYRVWYSRRSDGINLHFVGQGFLRYQVRRMVGALFSVGWGAMSLADFRSLVDDPQPGASVLTASAQGLTLERVFYRRSPLFDQP